MIGEATAAGTTTGTAAGTAAAAIAQLTRNHSSSHSGMASRKETGGSKRQRQQLEQNIETLVRWPQLYKCGDRTCTNVAVFRHRSALHSSLCHWHVHCRNGKVRHSGRQRSVGPEEREALSAAAIRSARSPSSAWDAAVSSSGSRRQEGLEWLELERMHMQGVKCSGQRRTGSGIVAY